MNARCLSRSIKLKTFEGTYVLKDEDYRFFRTVGEIFEMNRADRKHDLDAGYIDKYEYEDYVDGDYEEASDAIANYCYDHELDYNISAILDAIISDETEASLNRRSKDTPDPVFSWVIYEDIMVDGDEDGNAYGFEGTADEAILKCIKVVKKIGRYHPKDSEDFSFWGVCLYPESEWDKGTVAGDHFTFYPEEEVEWISNPKYCVGEIASKPVNNWHNIKAKRRSLGKWWKH